jgi:hypothetical protein
MHSSGWIRIIAIVVGVAVMWALRSELPIRWYFCVPLALLAFFAVPVLIGIAFGLRDRRYLRELTGTQIHAPKSKDRPPPADLTLSIRPPKTPSV